MFMKYKNIMWDWNGTLMDDVGIALEAVNIMLKRRGLPCITIAQYYDYIDTPIIRFYERCFDMTKDDESTLLPEFQMLYAELSGHLPENSDTYDAVSKLHSLGVRQFVVSSSEINILNHWIEKYKITNFIEGVTGADNLCAESKVGRAKQMMKKFSLRAEDTVFIGDTLHDLETATAIGTSCILVTYGHSSPDENKKTGCFTADSLDEIVKLFIE